MRNLLLGLGSVANAGFWDDFWGNNDDVTTTTTTTFESTTTTPNQNEWSMISGTV